MTENRSMFQYTNDIEIQALFHRKQDNLSFWMQFISRRNDFPTQENIRERPIVWKGLRPGNNVARLFFSVERVAVLEARGVKSAIWTHYSVLYVCHCRSAAKDRVPLVKSANFERSYLGEKSMHENETNAIFLDISRQDAFNAVWLPCHWLSML